METLGNNSQTWKLSDMETLEIETTLKHVNFHTLLIFQNFDFIQIYIIF